MLVHGEEDDVVPFDQSVHMARAYRSLGLRVELIAVKNAGHDLQHMGTRPMSPFMEVIHQETVEFLTRNLISPTKYSKKELQ